MEAGYYSQDFIFFDDIVRDKCKSGCGILAKKFQYKFNKPMTNALHRVLIKLSEARKSTEQSLIQEQFMTEKQIYHIPFSFGILIEDMSSRSDPIDVIDISIKKRKERGNKAFRKWLNEYDYELRKDISNMDRCIKIKEDIDQTVDSLRSEYPSSLTNKKIIYSLSNFGSIVLDIIIRLEIGDTSSIIQIPKACFSFFESLDSLASIHSKIRFPHRFYMQSLARADTKILKKLELKKIFGDEGKEFASILKYYSVIGQKADEIILMK